MGNIAWDWELGRDGRGGSESGTVALNPLALAGGARRRRRHCRSARCADEARIGRAALPVLGRVLPSRRRWGGLAKGGVRIEAADVARSPPTGPRRTRSDHPTRSGSRSAWPKADRLPMSRYALNPSPKNRGPRWSRSPEDAKWFRILSYRYRPALFLLSVAAPRRLDPADLPCAAVSVERLSRRGPNA